MSKSRNAYAEPMRKRHPRKQVFRYGPERRPADAERQMIEEEVEEMLEATETEQS